jgi:hypothetical protein
VTKRAVFGTDFVTSFFAAKSKTFTPKQKGAPQARDALKIRKN